MYSYSKPQRDQTSGQSYSRILVKAVANCGEHQLTFPSVQLWKVEGGRAIEVTQREQGRKDVAPGTLDDLVVAQICKGPPPAKSGASR